MKNLKKLLCVTLTSSLLVASNSLYTLANSDNQSSISSTTSYTDKDISVSPRSSQRVLLTDLTATDGSQSEYFSIASSNPYYKVWVYNQSDVEYTVTITKDSPSGKIKETFKVEAGKEEEPKFKASKTGSYYVNISSESGVTLKGKVGVRVATSLEEL